MYCIDQNQGAWNLIDVFDAPANPAFLALDSQKRFLYCAHGHSSKVSAFAIDRPTGRLKPLNVQPTEGDNSPHLSVAPGDRYLILANGPGMAVFPINSDGSIAAASDVLIPPGAPGPYRKEQQGAHPHQVLFDPSEKFLVAPDKGVDRIHVYRLDTTSGRLAPNDPPGLMSRYGAAPRHIAFHPVRSLAYVINELDSTIVVCEWNPSRGELQPFQVVPTTPDAYTGNNTGAEIMVAPSGNFLYVSNRGHDSIGLFAIDASNGRLKPIGWEPTQGRSPRCFALTARGDLLYAANRDSDSIVEFRVDDVTGMLTATGQIVRTGAPSCIVFTNDPT